MDKKESWYIVLGVNPNSSDKEIRAAYLVLVKKYHPDKNIDKSKEETEAAAEKLKEINIAFEASKKRIKSTSELTETYRPSSSYEDILRFTAIIFNTIRFVEQTINQDEELKKEFESLFKNFNIGIKPNKTPDKESNKGSEIKRKLK